MKMNKLELGNGFWADASSIVEERTGKDTVLNYITRCGPNGVFFTDIVKNTEAYSNAGCYASALNKLVEDGMIYRIQRGWYVSAAIQFEGAIINDN